MSLKPTEWKKSNDKRGGGEPKVNGSQPIV